MEGKLQIRCLGTGQRRKAAKAQEEELLRKAEVVLERVAAKVGERVRGAEGLRCQPLVEVRLQRRCAKLERDSARRGLDAPGEDPEQVEPLAGPGKGVAQVEGEHLGQPRAERGLALDADPEYGLVGRGPLEPGLRLAHGQDVEAARQGVDAGCAVHLHGGELRSGGKALHAGHGGFGREGDDGL